MEQNYKIATRSYHCFAKVQKSIFIIVLLLSFYPGRTCSQKQHNKEFGYTLEKIGAPVKSLPYLNFTLAEPDKGLESDIVFNSFNQNGVYFARYNHVTDKVSSHQLKKSVGLWGITNYNKDKIFMGGCTKSQLYEYDIKNDIVKEIYVNENLSKSSLGYVLGEDYIWSLSTAPDGKIYGVTYPNCKLFSFNPATRITIDFGTMVEGEKYARYVCTDFPGKVFVGVGPHAGLIEFDPVSKLSRQILPKEYRNQSFAYHLNRFGNYLVVMLSPDPIVLIFDTESRKVIKEFNMKDHDPILYLQKTAVYKDKFYFGMLPHDNLYSIDKDLNLKQEFENVGGPIGLASERYLYCISALKKFTIIDLKENKIVKRFFKNIQGKEGVNIFAFTKGPDSILYGGGFINQHLFSFNPDKNSFNDYGVSINVPGQINSIITFKNKIYSGHYISAEISEFDPKQEWNPGIGDNYNPHVVTSIKNEQDKILDMDTDGEKYIYIASAPTYGKNGGCLVVFEPETRDINIYRNIIPEQTPRVVKLLKNGYIALGGYIFQSKETAAKLVIWNPKTRTEVNMVTPLEKSKWITGIIEGNDNKLFSCVDSSFFIYDYISNKIEFIKDPGLGNIYSLLYAKDGFIYGVSISSIFRFNPVTKEFKNLFEIDAENFVDFILQDIKGRIFIAARENIYKLTKE